MLVRKTSILTGKINEMELDVTPENLISYARGEDLVQNIFPWLNAAEREFLMTGVTPEEWAEAFPEEDEE